MNPEAYEAVHARVATLVREGDPETPVPACPGWRVRDVLAHLVGLCEDWVDHRLDGYGSKRWTDAQVTRASGESLEQVMERWRVAAERFAQLDDDPVMGSPARWAFGDAVTHEADIRGALRAGRVPSDAVVLSLKGSVARWRETMTDASAPTLRLQAPDARDWWLGVHGDPEAVVVEAPAYEFFRALTGRRSVSQLRLWNWSGNPDPYLSIGLPYPFHWAAEDLLD
ncbi:MAG: maleylpyruvate isomerase family mycothiol-dependent enzyme [Acidimicrobiales bacterium]